jgi:NAD(P)-dependent dehydrogenase (short-subunit alcohol dehydrogenase family)
MRNRQRGKAVAIKGDVPKAADVQQLFDKTKYAFAPVCVLVNNAGVFKFEPLEAYGGRIPSGVQHERSRVDFNDSRGSILQVLLS